MKEILKKKALEVNKILEPFVPVSDEKNDLLTQAMTYALTAGGKRLRPIMMMEAAKIFGSKSPCLHDFMAAVEMIHNSSLIHDDLPCMDDDKLRHGKPANHVVYGEGMALLAGDGLLNLAYETVFNAIKNNPSQNAIIAGDILARAAGAYGILGGQAVELSFENREENPGQSDISYIYLNKTAKLIMASLEIGGVLADASDGERKALRRAGECLGIAFQIEDDILDIVGDEEKLGKPIGSDAENDKYTFVSAYGIEEAKARVKSLTDEAIESLLALKGDTTFLRELFLYLIGRES